MKYTKIALFLALMSLMSACANQGTVPTQSVGAMPMNKSANYTPVPNQQSVRVEVVKEYVPVPIPGQLMPTPDLVTGTPGNAADSKQVFLTKEAAVQYANNHALLTPQSQDFFNAMMTYDYMPGSLYTVYTAPMKITDVVLQSHEKIISIAAGDTLRWMISQTYSGQGANMQQHILIKPNSAGLQNTLVVTTNKRVYHLVLVSTSDNTYMVSVSWRYPSDMVQFSDDAQNNADAMNTNAGSDSNASGSPYQLDLGRLDFNYKFGLSAGHMPEWYPVRVFNDGRQTFIEFPKTILSDNAPLPMLFVADNNGVYGTMYNWRQKGRYMVIDAVIKSARLQTGVDKKDQTIVQIEYTSSKTE